MDPNAGNPYMQGGNPFMPDKSQTPMSGGEMMGSPAPMNEGPSETTKPRQMPGGSDPMGGGDMPLGPGGAGAPAPMGDTNTPQPDANAHQAMREWVQAIRRDVMLSNPEINTQDAHRIALRVVALQSQAAPGSPQATQNIGDLYNQRQQRQQDQRGRGQGNGRGSRWGDLNNPNNPNSPLHPSHPMNKHYAEGEGEAPEPNNRWESENGGRNRLEDHAYGQNYRGNNPHAWAAADLLAQHVTDRFYDRRDRKRQQQGNRPASRVPEQGQRRLP